MHVQGGGGQGQDHYPAADRDHGAEQRDGRPEGGELRQPLRHKQAQGHHIPYKHICK